MANRPFKEFRDKRLGKRVDYDGRVGFQCVDLFKQYMDEVLGIKCKASGSAKDIRKNSFKPFKQPERQKHIGMSDLMQGDVVCATCGRYGHIAIIDHISNDKIYVLEQNGLGTNKALGTKAGDGRLGNAIRVKAYLPSFRAGVRRCQKIFDNLQLERGFINGQLSQKDPMIVDDSLSQIRYLAV